MLRDAATLGLALGGLGSLGTGLALLAVFPAGTPAPLVLAFLVSVATTLLCALTIVVMALVSRRSFGRPETNGDRM